MTGRSFFSFLVPFLVATAGVALSGASAQEVACVSAGNVYKVGAVACIPACHGAQRLARCDLVSDAPQWTTVSNACPSAFNSEGFQLAQSTPPALAAPMTPAPAQTARLR